MKKQLIPYLTLLLVVTSTEASRAQERLTSAGSIPGVSEEFHVAVGQGTNASVTARQVTLEKRPLRMLVFYSSDAREAVAAPSTNQVCFLAGRLFAVFPGVQCFWIYTSTPIGTNGFTGELAARLAGEALYPPLHIHEGQGRKVDLTNLLKQEQERHLAQMLLLRNAEVRVERGELLVSFKSQTGLHGTVVLDKQLNTLSEALDDTNK